MPVSGETRMEINYAVNRVRLLERIGVDLLLFDDRAGNFIPGDWAGDDPRSEPAIPGVDPAVLAPIIGRGTDTIGIGLALAPTSYPPFMAARLLSTLDHYVDGRAAWNVVIADAPATGAQPSDAAPDMAAVAIDYVGACRALWGSWDPDALVLDVESGVFADPSHVRDANYVGPFFKTRGPLNTTPSRQRDALPVTHVARSDAGLRFAAACADVVVLTGTNADEVAGASRRLKSELENRERRRDELVVLVAVSPQVSASAAGAADRPVSQAAWSVAMDGSFVDIAASMRDLIGAAEADGVAVVGQLDGEFISDFGRVLRELRGPARPVRSGETLRARLHTAGPTHA
nr:LLM class flavin-dependent oxidoreductase [Acuticoccus mangrovi]